MAGGMTARVAVRKNGDERAAVWAVLDALGLPDLSARNILIKPNLGRLTDNDCGIVTRTPVVAALIDWLQAHGCRKLALGDSPILGLKISDIYRRTGLDRVAAEKDVTLLDFDADPPATIAIPGGEAITSLKVYNRLAEYDYLISVPVMKMHMHTGVSLALKNMKGVIWRAEKVKLHQLPGETVDQSAARPLDIAVADMARVLRVDLALVDGTIAQEGMGPAAGSPRRLDLIVGSADYLAADYVAAQLMGLDPDGIHHLRLARKLPGQSSAVPVVDPVGYLEWRTELLPSPAKVDIAFPGVKLEGEQACSACMSSLLVFLKTYLPRLRLAQLPDGTLTIKSGKGTAAGQAGEICLGNCTRAARGTGVFIGGCPPVASHIFRALQEHGLIEGEFSHHQS